MDEWGNADRPGNRPDSTNVPPSDTRVVQDGPNERSGEVLTGCRLERAGDSHGHSELAGLRVDSGASQRFLDHREFVPGDGPARLRRRCRDADVGPMPAFVCGWLHVRAPTVCRRRRMPPTRLVPRVDRFRGPARKGKGSRPPGMGPRLLLTRSWSRVWSLCDGLPAHWGSFGEETRRFYCLLTVLRRYSILRVLYRPATLLRKTSLRRPSREGSVQEVFGSAERSLASKPPPAVSVGERAGAADLRLSTEAERTRTLAHGRPSPRRGRRGRLRDDACSPGAEPGDRFDDPPAGVWRTARIPPCGGWPRANRNHQGDARRAAGMSSRQSATELPAETWMPMTTTIGDRGSLFEAIASSGSPIILTSTIVPSGEPAAT